MPLELCLSFAVLRADLARVTSVFFDPDVLSIFDSTFFQMLLGFPCCFKLFVAFRALLVFGCIQLRIFSALLSQHFLKFLVRVCLIRLFWTFLRDLVIFDLMTLYNLIEPGLIKGPFVWLSLLLNSDRAGTDCLVSLGLHISVQVVDVCHHNLRRSKSSLDEPQRKCVLLVWLDILRVARDLLLTTLRDVWKFRGLRLISKKHIEIVYHWSLVDVVHGLLCLNVFIKCFINLRVINDL